MNIPHIGKVVRLYLTSNIAVFAFGSVSTALAVPPDKINFGFQDLEVFIADCGTFQVLNDVTIVGHLITHLDQDGNITKENLIVNISDSVYYNSEVPDVNLLGGPGEVVVNHFDISGGPNVAILGIGFKVTVPGSGVIFHSAGRLILDLTTFELIFQAGPDDFHDLNVGALCAALTP